MLEAVIVVDCPSNSKQAANLLSVFHAHANAAFVRNMQQPIWPTQKAKLSSELMIYPSTFIDWG